MHILPMYLYAHNIIYLYCILIFMDKSSKIYSNLIFIKIHINM